MKPFFFSTGAATSSVTNYLSAKSEANMDQLRSEWELDDTEMEILNRLGMEIYEYKCQIASDYDIPIEMTLSTKDLEAFVDYSNDSDPTIRMIKLQNLDTRLEILPDYWRELALTAYELGHYEETLNYIEKLCKSQGYDSIRLDCFIENPYSRKLYDKAGYSVVGYADWRKGRFELREKKI